MNAISTSPDDYAELSQALRVVESPMGASEAHGVVCGVICGAVNSEAVQWVSLLLADLEGQPKERLADLSKVLLGQHRLLETQLRATDFSFQLLLPGSAQPLVERLQGLANWCRGYLFGMVAAGIKDVNALPAEVAELLRDFVEISEVIPGTESDEEQEREFTELEEYVRLGVQHVYEELREPAASQAPPTVN